MSRGIWTRLGFWLVILLISLAFVEAIEAAPIGLRGRALLSARDGAGGDGVRLRRADLRGRGVRIDLASITGADAAAGADAIGLNLFPDVDLAAERIRFERRDDAHFTWHGKVADDPLSMVILVAGDGLVSGSVFAHGKHYAIRGGDAESQQVVEIDQSAFPREQCDAIPENPIPTDASALQDSRADSGAQIDVLVVYTPSARAAEGGTVAMENLISLAVAETNTSYGNSGITPRLTLVHAAEVAYTETGNWDLDLTRLQTAGDGYMDEVHTLRDAYKADAVVLLINNIQFCGLASAIMADASSAFCLVAYDCATGNYTFGHELGHLQGARHDWYVDNTNNSPFSYNHGDIDLEIRRRTVMSYNDQCLATFPGTSCTRVPYWSNPGVNYPSTTRPAGSTIENNAMALNATAPTVANFRFSVTYSLTVESTYPAAGVSITVSPSDLAGQGSGTTTLTRTYDENTVVTLTAPATADGNPFGGWSGCTSTSGTGNTICYVTMDAARTVVAGYVRDTVARPTAFTLRSRSDAGRAAIWEVDPGTGALQKSVWLHSSAGIGAPWQATSYQRVDASTGYVLWSRSDTGQAALWTVTPATGARTNLVNLGWAVGAPWQAASYAHAGASVGYVLWTRSDTGQAVLWKVNPATGAMLGLVTLGSSSGVGAPWQATSYVHAGPSTGYVLWSRSDTGQAVLWTVDPGTGVRTRMASVTPSVGAPWLATGYEQAGDTNGYVLWTRSDTGAAAVWTIDPSLPTPARNGLISLHTGTSPAYPAALVGGPWQATAYVPVNAAPTIAAVGNVTIDEDSLLSVGLTGITSGGDAGQPVTVSATSSNTALIPDPVVSYASPDTTGLLTATPVANASGTVTITVWVNDGQASNSPVSISFTVTVAPVNDAPTDIALSSRLADGGLPAGTAVGVLSTTDPDAGDTFTYALVAGAGDTDNTLFALAGAGGSQLVTNAVLDYAARTSYSIRVQSTDQGLATTEKAFTIVRPAYTLWSRGDTGQAQLWQVDPDTGARGSSVTLGPSAGVGGPWLATSFARVDSTTGYVLWSRNDTGQSVLWKVDPSTGAWLRTVTVGASAGVGAPWLATSFVLADPATGYVMWTRSDTGQGVVSRLDLTNFDLVTSIARGKPKSIFKKEGTGGPWQATSLMLADPTTAHVLWSRSDNGRAVLWRVDFTNYDTLDVLPVDGWANVGASTGVGAPWLATGYEQTATNAGNVLWTRSDLGQAVVWSVDPSTLPAAILQVAPLQKLHTGTGMGSPWQATSHSRP